MPKSKKDPDKILLVEGSDDKHVILQICVAHGIPEVFKIEDSGGVERLTRSISAKLKQSKLDTLGLVLDADTDLAARWRSLAKVFGESDYLLPDIPPVQGYIADSTNSKKPMPKLGIWLMPDNHLNGTLEDFLEVLVTKPSGLLEHADKSIEAIPAHLPKFRPQFKTKALIHTYLAWQEEPGKPFGQALKARYLDSGDPLAQRFAAWLTKLFS